jgi:uncharacterized damage-inducible protein DinB
MTTATASAATRPIAMIFAFNEGFVPRALDGLTPEELWRRPSDHNNPMLWVAGHVVQTRAMILGLLGERVDTGWGQLFNRGAAISDTTDYPGREAIEQVMRDVSPRLRAKLAALDDGFLARPATIGVPGTSTVGDELAFFALHESYHIGQLSFIRKALGYPGLAG